MGGGVDIGQAVVTIVASFFFSIVAIVIAQLIWGFITGPRIVLSLKGLGEAHPVNKVRYYKIGIRNEGATAAKDALVRIRVFEKGGCNGEIEVTPKWDAIPEASISGFSYLYDSMQRITIPPGGMHEELVPIIIVPTEALSNYKPHHIYLFSNWRHYSSMPVDDVELVSSNLKGILSLDSENCYVIYDFKAIIKSIKRGEDVLEYTIDFTEIKPNMVKWWMFSKGKVERLKS